MAKPGDDGLYVLNNSIVVDNAIEQLNAIDITNSILIPAPPSGGTSGFLLENGSGVILLESGDILLLEVQ